MEPTNQLTSAMIIISVAVIFFVFCAFSKWAWTKDEFDPNDDIFKFDQ